ncbi:MAG TPA: PEP-CTERM sorting domain-containing protein [Trichormus sp. M33_DOE_039]|nr:PEP-CTERM sorting domain-containing protein [Trichormus sp. M33_DOE_039]
MKSKFFHFSASVLLATGIAGAVVNAPAQAAPKPDVAGICQVSDISLGGVIATACDGATAGNDTGSGNPLETRLDNGLFSSFVGSGVNWTELGKSDNSSNGYIKATNDDNDADKLGDWSLLQQLSSNTFVVSLKSSTYYSAYLFQDYDWSNGLTGVFNTIGVALDGSGTAGKNLSHASLFVSDIKNTPDPQAVPEPATLFGLGLVASGMVISRRRQSR